jgi:hypothetical protein
MANYPIPDDLKEHYRIAHGYDAPAGGLIRGLIERIARLTEENARLKAPFDGAVIASLMEVDKKRFPNVLDTVNALIAERSKPQEAQ